MSHLCIIIPYIISALAAGVLIWRSCVIYKILCTGKKSTHSTDTPTSTLISRYTHTGRVFFKKPVAAILHMMVVIALLCMLVHALCHALSYRTPLIDHLTVIAAVGAIIAAIGFILRRCICRVARFSSLTTAQRRDAITILLLEILSAMTVILAIRYSEDWWGVHYMTMAVFAVYVTYSKHLHIVIALMSVSRSTRGDVFSIGSIPEVSRGIDMMEGKCPPDDTLPEKMGAEYVSDMNKGDRCDIFSCTQCGRCDEVCPVRRVGEDFSPLQIVAEARVSALRGEALYPKSISERELSLCISCGACAVACPIGISAMKILWEVKRYACLEKGSMPASYHSAAQSTSNSGFPLPTQKRQAP